MSLIKDLPNLPSTNFGETSLAKALWLTSHGSYLGLKAYHSLGDSGQIEIYFHGRLYHGLEVTVEPDGSITVAEDFKKEQLSFEENVSFTSVVEKITQFAKDFLDRKVQSC